MKVMSRALVVLMALLPLACSAAEEPRYKFGEHYTRVRAAQAPANPNKIEVMEVFAYSCQHCYAFEPLLKAWVAKLPGDVEFVRLPHTLGHPVGEARNKAFYTARMLGVFDKFHPALFEAIHSQKRAMTTVDEVRALFVERAGIKAADFDAAYSSFAVDAGFRRGENAIRGMGISGVPAMVVNGQYVASGGMAGGLKGLLSVTDFLVEQARKERGKK
ncbi:MAG: thiol:disulfide interchange protein DsbA/DsbL [Gammaproteobacteria bacterium]